MKMSDTDYNYLQEKLSTLVQNKKEKVLAHKEALASDTRVKDLGMRFRWDLLWAAKVDLNAMYVYLNDSHIDTALKAIVKELEL